MKCAECVRLGRPCVNLSWESLDQTRSKLRKELDEHEDELSELMAKILRKKKILRQADERAKQKTLHLMEEMEASGELEDCPAAAIGIAVSPSVWNSLGYINEAVGVNGNNEPIAGGLGVDPTAFVVGPLVSAGT